MIGVYATTDAAYSAETVAAALRRDWPEIDLIISNGHPLPALPVIGNGGQPEWDDLLIFMFGTAPLPDTLHEPIMREVAAAHAENRPCRILPVSTHPGQRRPPPPLSDAKAIDWLDPSGPAGQRLARRVGALMWLWLRDDERKVFVSHCNEDGQVLATQVTAFLRGEGYDAWRDEERLAGGELVQDVIERTIADADFLLLLDTPKAQHCDWIVREVDMAIGRFVPVVSVVLRPPDSKPKDWRNVVYSTSDLVSHQIAATLMEKQVVAPLTDGQLDSMLVAVEEYLSGLWRSQQALQFKVKKIFREASFDWQPIDARRSMFACSKREDKIALIRLLSHCAEKDPNTFRQVKALQAYRDRSNDPAAGAFNHRLFIYEPVLADSVLWGLAREHGFDHDPLLRLLSPRQLEDFLCRYQAQTRVPP
ncbi:MAG TPA: toll/interleukin-1 receptor domain-containing protein [Lamprocystis sp. (in: g-proteobacteria)]|nr:toll/interleukin-1 receptor domain-containing protein [Lamprocystis sp. (in: g-proteobacteria)]